MPPTAQPLPMEQGNGSPNMSVMLTVYEGYEPALNETVDENDTVDLEAHKAANNSHNVSVS
jgi:hypothetical protein